MHMFTYTYVYLCVISICRNEERNCLSSFHFCQTHLHPPPAKGKQNAWHSSSTQFSFISRPSASSRHLHFPCHVWLHQKTPFFSPSLQSQRTATEARFPPWRQHCFHHEISCKCFIGLFMVVKAVFPLFFIFSLYWLLSFNPLLLYAEGFIQELLLDFQ